MTFDTHFIGLHIHKKIPFLRQSKSGHIQGVLRLDKHSLRVYLSDNLFQVENTLYSYVGNLIVFKLWMILNLIEQAEQISIT